MPPTELIAPLFPIFLIVSFVLGSMVGSFANVCICRWPAGESVVSPRSRCPKCRNSIAWYDNIPIVSWLILDAKCRHCDEAISWQYPLVEAITGSLFLLVAWRFGFSLATPVYMGLSAALVIVTFQDLADWTIPNQITFPGIPIGLGLSLVGMAYPDSLLQVAGKLAPFNSMAGIALGAGILYLMDRITVLILKKPGMGFGDVKLLAMIGAFLGWKGVAWTLAVGAILGSVVGVTMILCFKWLGKTAPEKATGETEEPKPDQSATEEEKQASDEDEITLEGHYLPFGPYLALASLLYMFFGPELIEAYLASMRFEPLGAIPLP